MNYASTFRLPAALAVALLAAPALAQSTDEVLQHHLDAFGAGDVDAIMSDYAPDAVVINQDTIMIGHDEIRPLFDAFVAEFGKPAMSFEMVDRKVEGDIAYIVWSAETADNVYDYATDTLVIRDGKIAYQTLAGVITAK